MGIVTEYMGIKLIGKPEIVMMKDNKYALINWKNLTGRDRHNIETKVYSYWSSVIANSIMFGLHCHWDSGYSWVDFNEIKLKEEKCKLR